MVCKIARDHIAGGRQHTENRQPKRFAVHFSDDNDYSLSTLTMHIA